MNSWFLVLSSADGVAIFRKPYGQVRICAHMLNGLFFIFFTFLFFLILSCLVLLFLLETFFFFVEFVEEFLRHLRSVRLEMFADAPEFDCPGVFVYG